LCGTNRRNSKTANHSDSGSSLGANNLLSLSIFSSERRNQCPTPTQTNPLSLFFTAPTQATGPGNFTDYRIHTTTTPMTTTSAMASEQNPGAVGFIGGGPEQDEAMGGPVAGQEGQIPEPPVMYLQCVYGQRPSKHSRDNLKCEVQVNPSFRGSLRKIASARREIR
jgi:hypothetical protein